MLCLLEMVTHVWLSLDIYWFQPHNRICQIFSYNNLDYYLLVRCSFFLFSIFCQWLNMFTEKPCKIQTITPHQTWDIKIQTNACVHPKEIYFSFIIISFCTPYAFFILYFFYLSSWSCKNIFFFKYFITVTNYLNNGFYKNKSRRMSL
jgi:hypothetical protein